MRIRSIKPEFWRSDDIAALSIEDRLLYIGLWSYVDDNGVGLDKLASIAADLFALDLERDPSETFARVSRGLARLAAKGLIVRYEAEGRPLVAVPTWTSHQRVDKPGKIRYPAPTSTDTAFATPSRDSRDTLAPGTGEQGNRGEDSSSPLRVDVAAILDHLDDRIRANGAKVPTRGKTNLDAARLLLDADKRNPAEVHQIIDWATSDDFWRSNILSASTLRRQYDKLRLASHRRNGKRHTVEADDWL